jgi:hypothetical protein
LHHPFIKLHEPSCDTAYSERYLMLVKLLIPQKRDIVSLELPPFDFINPFLCLLFQHQAAAGLLAIPAGILAIQATSNKQQATSHKPLATSH